MQTVTLDSTDDDDTFDWWSDSVRASVYRDHTLPEHFTEEQVSMSTSRSADQQYKQYLDIYGEKKMY
jgi:hypothetical protein